MIRKVDLTRGGTDSSTLNCIINPLYKHLLLLLLLLFLSGTRDKSSRRNKSIVLGCIGRRLSGGHQNVLLNIHSPHSNTRCVSSPHYVVFSSHKYFTFLLLPLLLPQQVEFPGQKVEGRNLFLYSIPSSALLICSHYVWDGAGGYVALVQCYGKYFHKESVACLCLRKKKSFRIGDKIRKYRKCNKSQHPQRRT